MTWARTSLAPDRTHHLLDGAPLYARRFDDVLKFRAPGLAAVRLAGEAWHIDPAGQPAYPQRYLRTFNFYEGRAAFRGPGGWGHILPDGSELYRERYDWCGNFQGGRCAVRTSEGGYFHLRPSGEAAYPQRWRYAGDFREGVGVVMTADGRSTHIDEGGRVLHGVWFLDVDVFHKGYARARDERGWTHVDRAGRVLYPARFRAVEPFYNGQARVERLDGSPAVIDEAGDVVVVLCRGDG